MKALLDWRRKEVVDGYDEVNLWSAPFGRLLLDRIPMRPGATVLDIGFGTGFPLLELSQRFGASARIYGIDPWSEGVRRTREKMRLLGLENIEIFERGAETIPLPDRSVDLICSNLGINNFTDRTAVLRECRRVLRPTGSLCLTTNPRGTFSELFTCFDRVLQRLRLAEGRERLAADVARRATPNAVATEFAEHGFACVDRATEQLVLRFADAAAVLDYGIIRIGFRAEWESWIPPAHRTEFFDRLIAEIASVIDREGSFRLTVPLLYLGFALADP